MVADNTLALSLVNLDNGLVELSKYYIEKSLEQYQTIGNAKGELEALEVLSRTHERLNQYDSAYFFLSRSKKLNDSINSISLINEFQNLAFSERLGLIEIEQEQQEFRSNILLYSLLAFAIFIIVISLVIYSGSIKSKKANIQLTMQKSEIEYTLTQLRSTQSQLIHSEKMASLGELTAGIAHEIQNPLNFVNNFSEVNKEMLDELNEAIENNDQEEIKAILKDLKENEDKVNQHGKRAEGIVKSMLQHSRTGSGEKEPTDINTLCDEYLRLAYHGFRAKDKAFNSDFKLDLNESLPKINVVPQDIGRVLLNLINNAFQAVKDVDKPLVTVLTKNLSLSPSKRGMSPLEGGERGVLITISDNGPGIPDDIKDKIFEPFFTTKPTGEGTGLGLSMSYDIVTKGHGGTIEVESREGKWTEFIIQLPMSESQIKKD
ncbi:MAG: hypothetical protein JXQ90_04930 [Cyclobacteriaceae bacterium]